MSTDPVAETYQLRLKLRLPHSTPADNVRNYKFIFLGMRNLASIQTIAKVEPIDGADAIEKVTVLGWHCVAKKGEFKEGDKCIYFEVDSLLPMIDQFSFLAKGSTKKMLVDGKEIEGYRLRTVRLRGQISQGLALPLSAFDGLLNEGDNIVAKLGIVKYEPPVPVSLAGKIRGLFPSFIPKTDETRIQSVPQILERYKNVDFYISEKMDGSSVTMFWKDDEFHVCSRNLDLINDGNTLWRVANEMGFPEKMEGKEGLVLQGEIVGEGIQKNPLKIKGQKIYIFNAYNWKEARYYDLQDFLSDQLDIERVPIITTKYRLPQSVDELVSLATTKSAINPESWIEGLVFRPTVEIWDEDLGRLSFKVINPEYLLSGGESL